VRVSDLGAMVVVAIFLAILRPPASGTGEFRQYPVVFTMIARWRVTRLASRGCSPVIHARPIAEAQREERSEINLSATTITRHLSFDHLFGGS